MPKCSLQTSRKLSFLCDPKSIQCAYKHKHLNFIYTFTATESHEVNAAFILSFPRSGSIMNEKRCEECQLRWLNGVFWPREEWVRKMARASNVPILMT